MSLRRATTACAKDDTFLGEAEDVASPIAASSSTADGEVNRPLSRRNMTRRKSFAQGEQFFPSRQCIWTIDDGEETMDDVSIVINLLADLSPAGILPLSFGMIGTGYVPSVALLLLFASAAAYMMYLVGRTIEISGAKSYDRIWSNVVGPETAWVPTLVVFAVCFGCCLAYACMFGDLFAGCMPAFGVAFASRSVCLVALSVFPLLPLCMLKDLSALAPTSFGALVAVLYTLVMMIIRYTDGTYSQPLDLPQSLPTGNHMMTLGPSSLLLVNGLAVAFLCHYNGCKYYREYICHRPDRFGSKVMLAFSVVSLMFAVAMLCGYATFTSLSDGVILNNYAADDTLANIARFGMGLANVFSFPLMFSGLREQSLALMTFVRPSMSQVCELVWFQNLMSTAMLVLLTIVAVLVTDASLVIGLVGSICGAATIYVIPCFLFDRATSKFLSDDSPNSVRPMERILVRTIGLVGVVLMFAGAIATLVF